MAQNGQNPSKGKSLDAGQVEDEFGVLGSMQGCAFDILLISENGQGIGVLGGTQL